ncbi:sensor histidine kinase [Gracilibacillus boraciitolerans]|uniref:sensor histidine kinase n=1 Tax=Gracilibacillus boraciitolerans TaxID=307521 RepID=UPI00130D8ED4|nr:sensor histidine kinase [Gracilibacillus boraciitolerans]
MIVAILIPLLTFGFVLYLMASDISEDKTKDAGMNGMKQISTNIEFITQDIENTVIFLIGQDEIQSYLTTSNPSVSQQAEVISLLIDLAMPKSYIFDISIIPNRSDSETLSLNPMIDANYPPLPNRNQFNPIPFQEYKGWTQVHNMQTASYGNKNVVTYMHPVRSIGQFDSIGMITVSIPESELSSILLDNNISNVENVLLLNEQQQILSAKNRDWLNRTLTSVYPNIPPALTQQSGFTERGEGLTRETVMYFTIPQLNWKLISLVPYDQYMSENRYVLFLTIAAASGALLCISALIIFFVQWVTKPLQKVTQHLREAEPDIPIPTYPRKSVDEVGLFIHSYNSLSDRIAILKEQVKMKEAWKKQLDLRALQAQINPHFLYNTLSSIKWKALLEKQDDIASMVGSLSNLLRFSLNKGMEFCEVQQEVEHAKHYTKIQASRVPGQFEIQFVIEEQILDRQMLKLVLQPLIENAIQHGFKEKKDPRYDYRLCTIELDQHMTFTIEDNGVGIESANLVELKRIIQLPMDQYQLEFGHYGLRNVHQRLMLHYGPEAGLQVSSTINNGTKVTFTIPIIEGETP